jgi:GMP synthase-like glutamine amidotransferase
VPLFLTALLPECLEGAGAPKVAAAPPAAAAAAGGGGSGQLRGIESHGFCVSRLPPGAVLLASSPSCAHEAFALGRNVLALQCHPEFDLGVVADKLWPGLVEQRHRLSATEAADARASFMRPTNNAALRDFVRTFCGIA